MKRQESHLSKRQERVESVQPSDVESILTSLQLWRKVAVRHLLYVVQSVS